jgi:sugar lactone lactonase YvrE
MIDTELSVSDRDRGVTREYRVGVVRNRLLTSMLLTGVLAGAIRSVGPPSEGTTRVRFALDAEGLPRLERENTYAIEEGEGLLALLLGPAAAVGSATEELSRILEVLQKSEFGEARLSRLAVEVEVSKRRRIAQLEHVRVDSPIVRPGDEVEVQATIRVANKGRVRRVERIRIPEGCPPGQVRVGIAGGRSAEWLRTRLAISDPRPESMAQMVEQMLQRPSNHELVIQVALPTVGVEARGFVFRDLPPAAIEVLRSAAASRLRTLRDYVEWRSPTEWVISGHTVLTLTVEGDEKDKGGKPPAPEARPSMFEEVGPGLAGLFSTLGLQASAVVGVEGGESEDEEVDLESPPQMPTWEEVEAVGEEEITLGELGEAEPTAAPAAREAIGRLASVWRLAAPKDLTGGRTDGVAVVSTGGLTLGGKASVLGRVDAQCAWPIAVDGEGVVYFGTWTDGCLRRAQADGQTSLVLETEDAGIQAVAAGEDGTIYAAAAPSGRIYRIPKSGEAVELCRLEARNVWALCADERGVLWAATGPEGKVYRVEPDGSASVAFQAPDRHVTTLAIGLEGTIYLGTSPRGKVYALEPGGGVRSVWEIEKAAAQSIAVDREGNVYLGTSPNGSVFRVSGDGTVRELAKLKAKHVLALHVTADGTLYAAGGPRSKVWVIWPDGTWGELYDPKTMFVAAMAGDRAGALYFTAADTGRVVKLDLASHRRGQFLSPVHDAKATARWGAVRWHGQLPSGTGMRLWTRTGDTAHPDATWSEWELLSGGAMPSVASPPGRFAQCQVELEGSGSARPRVEAVEISYLPANRTPEVSLAAPRGGEFWSGKQSVRWKGRDPDGDRLIYEVFWSADGGGSWHKLDASGGAASEGREAEPQESGGSEAGSPTPQEMSGNGEGLGAATGAGGLSYDGEPLPSTVVGLPAQAEEGESDREVPGGAEPATEVAGVGEGKREDGSQGESAVAAGRSTSLEWDTTEVDDGRYWIKVVGTDRAANPLDPREGETVSYSLIVDNTPPELIRDRRRQDEDPAPETITVFERTSYVTSAEFRLDGGEWLAAAAADDIFDSQLEAIVLDSGRLPAGTHRLEVRARDAAGNSASMELHYKR